MTIREFVLAVNNVKGKEYRLVEEKTHSYPSEEPYRSGRVIYYLNGEWIDIGHIWFDGDGDRIDCFEPLETINYLHVLHIIRQTKVRLLT